MKELIEKPLDLTDNTLQLSPIRLNDEYRKEWNVSENDFVVLTRNGKQINSSLYRVGGHDRNINQDYFMLIKYVEGLYEMDFMIKCHPTKSKKELQQRRKHLSSHLTILDREGNEKKVFDSWQSAYIKEGSCVYSLDSNYHNIETDELYCNAHSSMESSEFIFLDNRYDKDLSKRGVMKINKKDGSWSVYK